MNPQLKKQLLQSLEGNPRYKYKRIILSPIRYPGGKSAAVGHVVELLPDNIDRVVSPFFGGGSVEIAMSQRLDMEVIGYDIFDILINYWKFQIEQPEVLYNELIKLKPNQETYDTIKYRLEDHWDKTTKTFASWSRLCKRYKRYQALTDLMAEWERKTTLSPLDLAVCYYFNFNLSWGPGFLGWSGKIYLNDAKYTSLLKTLRNFRPKNLKVECADFQDVFAKHPNDFFYLDPPYFIGENSKTFQGIYPMHNDPCHHNGFKHEKLAELLKNHKGGFILSYNDCPQVREWYKDFQHSFPQWHYSMGQGETRIGKYRKKLSTDYIKESHEILVFSPPNA